MTREEILREIEGIFGEVPGWMREIPEEVLPELWGVFKTLELGETRIPAKYKELIGLAVSATLRCRYCVYFHTEAAKFQGATPEEVKEALVMASMVNLFSTYLNGSQYDLERFKGELDRGLEHIRRKVAVPVGR